MQILIHGRKNGYSVLFPKPTPPEFYSFASDIQSISANNDGAYYGCHFYTLAFAEGGCIFTKYVIGDDVERGQLGEIGISVFIPKDSKLSGAEVKTLLDELIEIYSINYINDNKIDEPKSGFNWFLFTALANEYDLKLLRNSYDNDSFLPGSQDPAFHYYNSDIELIEHLDKPFQDEYRDFKQILLIDSQLQGAANPLNVIKNSGITVNADLKNEPYYLNNYNRSKGVSITANGKPRSDKKGENQIRSKWLVEIYYSKDDRCYLPIKAKGTISDLSSQIFNYMEIKANHIMLKYDAFNPTPRIKSVKFTIKDRKGNVIDDSEIVCKNSNYQVEKKGVNNQIIFEGEEIIDRWKVIAHKGDFSGKMEFSPEKIHDGIDIIIEERNIISINVKDEDGKNLSNFEVWTKLTNGYQSINIIEFVDEQIIDYYHINVRKEGYEEYTINNFQPYKQDRIDVTLKRKLRQPQISKGQLPVNHESEGQKTFTNKVIVFFSKPAVIATSVVSLLIFGLGIYVLIKYWVRDKQSNGPTITAEQISSYVEGESLIPDTLYLYKRNWESQEQSFIIKSKIGIFGGDAKADSLKWKNVWKPINESLNMAIMKRALLKSFDFAELKNQRYSNAQQQFIIAINKIDSTNYIKVREVLSAVSTLPLTEIAEIINKTIKEEKLAYEKRLEDNNTGSHQTTQMSGEHNNRLQETGSSHINKPGVHDEKTSEILQYIKGSELKKEKLEEYKKTKGISQKLMKSIQTCLEFWELDGISKGRDPKTYYSFREKINKDTNFENSKLKVFVEKMCQEDVKPSYNEQDKKKGLK